jgi:hypothetical protein
VKVGQPATVTVNAANGEEFAAHVASIGVLASSSSSSTGAVSYPVTLALDQTGSKIRAGMSASADIVTGQVSGITVPSQALTGSTVTLVKNGRQTTQTVQTGLVGDSETQVVSGLAAGDQVLIRSQSALAGASATSSGTSATGLGGGTFGSGRFGGGTGATGTGAFPGGAGGTGGGGGAGIGRFLRGGGGG